MRKEEDRKGRGQERKEGQEKRRGEKRGRRKVQYSFPAHSVTDSCSTLPTLTKLFGR